jgi:uncharacterized membrane protein
MAPIAIVHVGTGLLALASGAIVFFNNKGTPLHRRMGYVYVFAMIALNVTALMIYRLFGKFGPFHVLAILSLITIVVGFIPAYRKQPRATWMHKHFRWMCGSYVGLAAATASEIIVRVPPAGFIQTRTMFFGLIIAASMAIGIAGGFLIRRYARAEFGPPRQ